MEKIQRMLSFDIQRDSTEDGQKKISGRPIVYGAIADIGDFFEVIEVGALDDTDMKDVPLLVNHNDKMIPLARSRRNNGNSTMTLCMRFQLVLIQHTKRHLSLRGRLIERLWTELSNLWRKKRQTRRL